MTTRTSPAGAPLLYEPGRIARIVFNRPEKKNALDAECWTLLADALETFAADPSARVLVLTGAGDEFSSGADLGGGITGSADAVATKLREVSAIITRLHTMPKPTLAVVPGVAAGVGMSLALCCDLVIAAERARFGAVFTRVGLSPDGGASWLLPRLVGPARAKELILTGRVIGADEAMSIGLLNRLVPTEDLAKTAEELAEQLAACPSLAATESLALLDEAWTRDFPGALTAEAEAQQRAVAARTRSLEDPREH